MKCEHTLFVLSCVLGKQLNSSTLNLLPMLVPCHSCLFSIPFFIVVIAIVIKNPGSLLLRKKPIRATLGLL